MGFVSIFKRDQAKFKEFVFDAVLSSNTEKRFTVTYLPLQEGAKAADHRIIEPIKVRMTGAMSNNPMKDLQSTFTNPEELLKMAGGAVDGLIASSVNNPYVSAGLGLSYELSAAFKAGDENSIALSGWKTLSDLAAESDPFTITTGLGEVLGSMVIERLYQETDPDNEGGLIFVADLIEFQYIKTDVTRTDAETPKAASAEGSGDIAPTDNAQKLQTTGGADTLAAPSVNNQSVSGGAPAQAVV